ncbi:NET1-associated nuclear protein 1 [Aspergillus melleus]|uniref:NET1-associated nuclear protein 1 n=1 Tax=Aspergillus melleus TaxID=138277 RepID=A0ACC3BH27_9EURO|nr:NET1-associated nuclear protein 1 [Aspergillus melleus]
MAPQETWTLSNTIAGQFSNIDPVLTSDEQYLFVGLESAVHVYSVTTSRLYRTLQLKSSQHIVGYALSPANQEHLFIFTSTGSVTRWDWLSGEQASCLGSRGKTISIDLSTHETDDHMAFRLTSLREHKDGKKEIVITTLSDHNPRETTVLQTAARISQIKVVRNGQVVVAYGSQNVLLGVACAETKKSEPSYAWREHQDDCTGIEDLSVPFGGQGMTYDINTNSHLSRQALARTNATTLSDVEALELLGRKEATGITLRETYLKFWKWNAGSGIWELATRVDGPHFSRDGPLPVLELASRPRGHEFATIGLDMVVRFWCPTIRYRSGLKAANDTSSLEAWKCRSSVDLSGYFTNHAPGQSTAASISFSQDGSVLAVCAQSVDPSDAGLAVLIDAQSCEVHYSRTGLYTGKPCVTRFTGCHLAIASEQSLSIWNIVDDTVRVVALPGSNYSATASPLLAVSPMTETFAVATPDVQENHSVKKTRQPQFRIRVYDIHSLSLVYQSPLRHCPLALLADPSSVDYIIVDSAANIQRLGSTKKISHSSQSSPDTAIQLHSGLASLFGSQLRGTGITSLPYGSDSLPRSDPSTAQSKSLATVFGDVPPFILPPANKLFHDVVHALSG